MNTEPGLTTTCKPERTAHHGYRKLYQTPIRFEAPTDACYQDKIDAESSALIVNPKASVAVILAAAQRRAEAVQQTLDMWARTTAETDINARDMAQTLEPTASETLRLIAVALRALRAEVAHG